MGERKSRSRAHENRHLGARSVMTRADHLLRQICDAGLRVLETACHLADLSLDFDHIIENEMRQDHEAVLARTVISVPQASVSKSTKHHL